MLCLSQERWEWRKIKDGIYNDFLCWKYTFDIQSRRTLANGELIDVYPACDALALNVLVLVLETILMPFLSMHCYHIKGRGGLKGAVRQVAQKSVDNFILKALRLYEQEHVQTRLERLGGYTKRWVR